MRRLAPRLPRPVRWLWRAILAVVAAESALLALGLLAGGGWLAAALQLTSLSVGPLALGLVVVLAAGARAGGAGRPPTPPEAPPSGRVPPEIAAGRRAGQVAISVVRSREGRAAIRRAALLARAARAAVSSGGGPDAQPEDRERPAGDGQRERP